MLLVLLFVGFISSFGSTYFQSLDTMSFGRLSSSSKVAALLIDWSKFL